MFYYWNILPHDIKNIIISFTIDKVFDLCLVDKYFNSNCKIIRIVDNKNYPKLSDFNLKYLINITSLNLYDIDIITDNGLKKLIKLNKLDLTANKIIADNGIKKLTNLTTINLDCNQLITGLD